jgi:hypothetical protein
MLTTVHRMRTFFRLGVNIASHEWLLTGLQWGNGGDIILLRSVLVVGEIYLFITGIKTLIASPATLESALGFAWRDLRETVSWYAPTFAGVYASLYGRYAAQWSYLANVYNRIKETEARALPAELNQEALAQWKVGFIEDADDLHLATKPTFAGVIRAWREPAVELAFKHYTHDGERRWQALMQRIDAALGQA